VSHLKKHQTLDFDWLERVSTLDEKKAAIFMCIIVSSLTVPPRASRQQIVGLTPSEGWAERNIAGT
jgi:hypothetical protein